MKVAAHISELRWFRLHTFLHFGFSVFEELRVNEAKAAELKWLWVVSTVLHQCFDWGACPIAYFNSRTIRKGEWLQSVATGANCKHTSMFLQAREEEK